MSAVSVRSTQQLVLGDELRHDVLPSIETSGSAPWQPVVNFCACSLQGTMDICTVIPGCEAQSY